MNLDSAVLRVLQDCVGKENKHKNRRIFDLHVWQICAGEQNKMPKNFDRRVRESLVRLSMSWPIVSSSKDGGYYLASTKEEFEKVIREFYNRAMKDLQRCSRLRTQAKEYGDDMLPGFDKLEDLIKEMERK